MEFCRSTGNESDTNLMSDGTYPSYVPATDIEFCKFILRRMFGYNINLRTWRALVGSSPDMYPRHNQKNDICNVRDQHHFSREFWPRISAARGAFILQ